MTKAIDLKILYDQLGESNFDPATPGSAGIDLRVVIRGGVCIFPGETKLVGTGIAIHINDPGYAGLILPRSGLGNRGLVLGNLVGLIDSDYIGEIKVSLWNRSDDPITVNHMDRVAQLIIVPVTVPAFRFVSEFSQSRRGDGGFGHTGV